MQPKTMILIQIALSLALIWAVAGIAYELDNIGDNIARITMVEVPQ